MLSEVDTFIRRHRISSGISAASIYAVTSAIAINVFQYPGGIYSGGLTGLAQLIAVMAQHWMNWTFRTPLGLVQVTDLISVGTLMMLFNLPLLWLSWRHIGHHFTLYTLLSVGLASLLMEIYHPRPLTTDPMLCGIMGAIFGGFGTGFALRSNISTGGVDIIELLLRKKTGASVGQVNIVFNVFVIAIAGALYGWPKALISGLCIVISGRIIDSQYTLQQRLQAIIVTSAPVAVTRQIQSDLFHGVTVLNNAEGGFKHEKKTILLTVISRAEFHELTVTVKRLDHEAFVSVTPVTSVVGNFVEPRVH